MLISLCLLHVSFFSAIFFYKILLISKKEFYCYFVQFQCSAIGLIEKMMIENNKNLYLLSKECIQHFHTTFSALLSMKLQSDPWEVKDSILNLYIANLSINQIKGIQFLYFLALFIFYQKLFIKHFSDLKIFLSPTLNIYDCQVLFIFIYLFY